MADVELLPLPEPVVVADELEFGAIYAYESRHMEAYARANLAPLQAENERLRADHAALRAEYYRVVHALQDEQARAERLAEALREAVGELASIGDAIGHDHPEARRIFTLRANLLSARFAALAQEDRND